MSDHQEAFKHIVHSFNAKTMSWRDIVNTFVPPSEFHKLAALCHTLILGARGSGKTTLLKMVSKNALDLWDDTLGCEWKNKINFTGIYIPADAIWESMLASIKKIVRDESMASLLMESAFATNVCMAVAQTVHECISSKDGFKPLSMSSEQYRHAVKEVAAIWDINPVSSSFLSLKHSLSLRLLELQKVITLLSCGLLNEERVQEMLMTDLHYAGKPIFEIVSRALEIVNSYGQQPDYTWALLFDEFEIVPVDILRQLLEQMRGGGDKQHVLFKVSLAPCGILTSLERSQEGDPSPMHDYQQITLWYRDKYKARAFCESICTRYLDQYEEASFHAKSPRMVFGDSPYFRDDKEKDGGSNMDWKKDFAELSANDNSFQEFLNRRKISLSSLNKSSPAIRKIAPLVSFRNAFPHRDGKTVFWRKPIKEPYSGWLAIADICEGNPRWLMSILVAMMDRASSSDKKRGDIPRNIQKDVLYQFSEMFYSILKSTPAKQFNESLKTKYSISEVLEKIGKYFKNQLLFSDFSDNPHLSFIVDKNIEKSIENCLRIAINHGALICLDEPDRSGGYKILIDKEIRFSYLLAPHFSLIPRQGNSIKLSTMMLSFDDKKKSSKKGDDTMMLPLD